MTDAVIAHCRAGFEVECAADIGRVAAAAGVSLSIESPSSVEVLSRTTTGTGRHSENQAPCPSQFGNSTISSRCRLTKRRMAAATR